MKPTLYSLIILIALTIQSCGSRSVDAPKDTGAIPDSVIKSVQTAPVVLDDGGGYIKLNGLVQPNETKQAKVFALVSGKVQSLYVELGDYVKKGQALAVIRSAEVAGTSNELALAESDVMMAEKNLTAIKEMYQGNLATEQDYMNARIAYTKSLSELNRAKQVSSITGGDNSKYIIKAPISGFVIEKNVTGNSEVRQDNNADLFAIADLSDVWVMANVYEADMNRVHLGDEVQVNTLANPGKNYTGKIDRLYNVLDPATRTMKVRINMNNPGNELKPEMFAIIKVNGKASAKSLSIPAQAIVMDNSKNYVIVKKDGKLSVREINLINRVNNKAYITGLAEGEEVVINSQVFLYQALINN